MKHTQTINQPYLFRRLYRKGTCKTTPYIAVYSKKNNMKINRMGITATRKIGNSVMRNRARRVIKEAYRLLEEDLPRGYDYVIVARKKSVYAKMQDIQTSLISIFCIK